MDIIRARIEEQRRRLDSASADLAAASSQLAIYDAAIAAGTPLPVPARFPFRPITPEHREKLLANGIEYKQKSTMDYVEYLRGAVPRGNESLARLRERNSRSLQGLLLMARKELDVADCANATARPTTLPRAMGKSTVTEEPVTGLA
ncbi:hypothetical protein VE02_09013 [Pseudogymnoascus sp. 03VT05]|nr:hypothetical protein VE02_09013 [Pseudogymnoascus sp. 03VT05]